MIHSGKGIRMFATNGGYAVQPASGEHDPSCPRFLIGHPCVLNVDSPLTDCGNDGFWNLFSGQ